MTTITKSLNFASNYIGKKKVPRYLYSIRPSSKVTQIRNQGFEYCDDDLFGEGVFMFDMANFLKFWNSKKTNDNIAKQLIEYVTRKSKDITLIRIPTAKLDKNIMSIRRQDTLMDITSKYNSVTDLYNGYAKKEFSEKIMDEISIGSPAIMANKFDRAKIPIEYIYPEPFKADIDVLGTATVEYGESKNIKKIFKELLKGFKESKFLDNI